MKTTAERETLRNTPDFYKSLRVAIRSYGTSGFQAGATRYKVLLRWSDSHFRVSHLTAELHLAAKPPRHQETEQPDFTEADKEWIEKIDRTNLSWDNW